MLSNKTEKWGGVESLSGFGNDGANVIIGPKKSCLKIKKGQSQSNIHPLSQL